MKCVRSMLSWVVLIGLQLPRDQYITGAHSPVVAREKIVFNLYSSSQTNENSLNQRRLTCRWNAWKRSTQCSASVESTGLQATGDQPLPAAKRRAHLQVNASVLHVASFSTQKTFSLVTCWSRWMERMITNDAHGRYTIHLKVHFRSNLFP